MSTVSMTIDEALTDIGATADLLTADERRHIDENGYVVLRGLVDDGHLQSLRTRLDELLEAEGDDAGKEVHQEAGTDRLANLLDKGLAFRLCYTQPKFLAAAAYILGGNLKFSSLTSRFALPGDGAQILHRDYGTVATPGVWDAINSIWMLDDFTIDNGATRVVPGSHLWLTRPPSDDYGTAFLTEADKQSADDLRNPASAHPQQHIVTGKAGDVVVFNCNLWHSGTLNRTQNRRRAIYSSFVRRDYPTQLDPLSSLSPATMASLSAAERFLIGV